jgi:hypothetical protein
LHPDLIPYLNKTSKTGFQVIQHPLVYSVPHSDAMNKMVNMRYLDKKEGINKALLEKDFSRYVWSHERPFRLNAFCDIYPNLDSETYWEMLGSIWTDTENSWQAVDTWEYLWTINIPNREFCMDEKEKEIYNSFDEKIIAYRGGIQKNKHGLSWTLDIRKAEFFANRFNQNGIVYEAIIDKENIMAYFAGRNESEIVVKPKSFKIKIFK